MASYNHMYTFAFEVVSKRADGSDVDASDLREACRERLFRLSDAEMLEACGAPEDSYLEEPTNDPAPSDR
jgi:chromosome condensin MukBEF MukE localization factor